MSEVIWYYDEAEGGGVQKVAGLGSYVKADDFHDMEADREAQRLRADTAEAERDVLTSKLELSERERLAADRRYEEMATARDCIATNYSQLSYGANICKEKLSASEQRATELAAGVQASVEVINSLHDQIAVLTELLHRSKVDAELWFSEFGEPSDGKYSAAFTEIDTALNPNPEAESHEPRN